MSASFATKYKEQAGQDEHNGENHGKSPGEPVAGVAQFLPDLLASSGRSSSSNCGPDRTCAATGTQELAAVFRGGFLAGVFRADAFLAGTFFAGVFLAGTFFAGVFFGRRGTVGSQPTGPAYGRHGDLELHEWCRPSICRRGAPLAQQDVETATRS